MTFTAPAHRSTSRSRSMPCTPTSPALAVDVHPHHHGGVLAVPEPERETHLPPPDHTRSGRPAADPTRHPCGRRADRAAAGPIPIPTCASSPAPGLARAATPRAAEVLIWALMAHLLPPERIIERLGAPWAVETIIATLEQGPSAVADVLAGIAAVRRRGGARRQPRAGAGPRPRSPRRADARRAAGRRTRPRCGSPPRAPSDGSAEPPACRR